MKHDEIKSPAHYRAGTGYEAWDVIKAWGLDYWLGSALKYISRCGLKGEREDWIKDAKKAIQFLQKKIEVLEDGCK